MSDEANALSKAAKSYALFDLDQTLVPWDTQLLFCNFILQKEPLRRLYLLAYLPLLPFAKILGTQGMKRVFLSYLAGMRRERLEAYAEEFAESICPSQMYAEMLDELLAHQERGDIVVLNSASPEIWVKPLAKKLGIEHAFGTRIDIEDKMPLFPDLIGENNKGEVKLGRMAELLPAGWSEHGLVPKSHGYSDSKADLPMLKICEQQTMVHPCSGLRAYGEPRGWSLVRPQRPTATKWQFALVCAKQALGLYHA